MTKIEEINELTNKMLKYSEAYYLKDAPLISDKEYDALFDKLKVMEDEAGYWLATSPTRKVQGMLLDGLEKVKHSKPMLSAAKTKDINEIKKFIGLKDYYSSMKMDGLTLVVRYHNGKFVQAITRGNGEIGEDVTEQAKFITNLPMSITYKEDLELRGECVISWDNFNKINDSLIDKYTHPRNLAAGSIRCLDTNITKNRYLEYIVFECVTNLDDSKQRELNMLDTMGFTTVKRFVGEQVEDCLGPMSPEGYEYPVDGVIFEYDSKKYSASLGATAHHESCRMAMKWADETYETILRDVIWETGRTGVVAPVAVFDEVDLDGALTTRATLHNVSIIKQLELGIGDTITIYRANMVIPKIDDNLTRSNSLKFPTICPCCGEPLVLNVSDSGTETLVCVNESCPAKQLAKFTHFVSKPCFNIDGLSEKILERLIDRGYVSTFADLFHLEKYKNNIVTMDGFGSKSYENLHNAIENARCIKLNNYITALGIPLIGKSAGKTISAYFNGDYNKFVEAVNNRFDFTVLEDFGKNMADSLIEAFNNPDPLWTGLSNEVSFVVEEEKVRTNSDGVNFFNGKTVCVTGAFETMKRSEIEAIIVAQGGKLTGSVSKKTDYLLTNDVGSGSTKALKAMELGTPIMSEVEFLSKIN